VEGELSVNLVLRAITIRALAVVQAHVHGVERALAALVASGVDAVLRCIALVRSRVERVPVSLHEVKLRAQVAPWLPHLVGVAVMECISPVVHDWHANG